VAAAAEDEDHRILAPQLRQLSALCGVIGELVIGKNCAGEQI